MSEQLQTEYGEEYWDAHVKSAEARRNAGIVDMTPVLDSMTHAILAIKPKYRQVFCLCTVEQVLFNENRRLFPSFAAFSHTASVKLQIFGRNGDCLVLFVQVFGGQQLERSTSGTLQCSLARFCGHPLDCYFESATGCTVRA